MKAVALVKNKSAKELVQVEIEKAITDRIGDPGLTDDIFKVELRKPIADGGGLMPITIL